MSARRFDRGHRLLVIDSRQAESQKTQGEVGRYQLVGAEAGAMRVNKVLAPPQKRIFRIDTVTGETEEFTERVDEGTYRCNFLGILR